MTQSLIEFRPDEFGTVDGGVPFPEGFDTSLVIERPNKDASAGESMWNLRTLADCLLDTPKGAPINEGLARDLARAALEAEKALTEYEAAVMGTLARIPAHWQRYRDLMELGEGIRAARKLGREAFERRLADV